MVWRICTEERLGQLGLMRLETRRVRGRVPTVRESQGILSESGKTESVREKSGNFKIPLTRPIIYALFSQFLPAPPDPHRGSAPNTAG